MSMENQCEKIQERMTDIFYMESSMDKDIEMHLSCCRECKRHFDALEQLRSDLANPEFNIQMDSDEIHAQVQKAFHIARESQKSQVTRRKEMMDFGLFIAIALALMTVVVGGVILGFGGIVLISQMVVAMVSSFLVPLAYILKMGREDLQDEN